MDKKLDEKIRRKKLKNMEKCYTTPSTGVLPSLICRGASHTENIYLDISMVIIYKYCRSIVIAITLSG
jgi:hypothetical protein